MLPGKIWNILNENTNRSVIDVILLNRELPPNHMDPFKLTDRMHSPYLLPDMKKGVDFTIYGVLSVAPEDFYLFGEIWLDETNKNYFRHIVPVMLYTGLNN